MPAKFQSNNDWHTISWLKDTASPKAKDKERISLGMPPGQWEMSQCNVSHWLGACLSRSLYSFNAILYMDDHKLETVQYELNTNALHKRVLCQWENCSDVAVHFRFLSARFTSNCTIICDWLNFFSVQISRQICHESKTILCKRCLPH